MESGASAPAPAAGYRDWACFARRGHVLAALAAGFAADDEGVSRDARTARTARTAILASPWRLRGPRPAQRDAHSAALQVPAAIASHGPELARAWLAMITMLDRWVHVAHTALGLAWAELRDPVLLLDEIDKLVATSVLSGLAPAHGIDNDHLSQLSYPAELAAHLGTIARRAWSYRETSEPPKTNYAESGFRSDSA